MKAKCYKIIRYKKSRAKKKKTIQNQTKQQQQQKSTEYSIKCFLNQFNENLILSPVIYVVTGICEFICKSIIYRTTECSFVELIYISLRFALLS